MSKIFFEIFAFFAELRKTAKANRIRFASQKIILRSLRFRFAIFFEKKIRFRNRFFARIWIPDCSRKTCKSRLSLHSGAFIIK
jgi:hypothetical protein